MNLKRFIRNPDRGFRGIQFGHRGGHLIVLTLILQPGRFIRHKACGFEFGRHLGYFEGDRLEFGDGFAELGPFFCIRHRVIIGRLGDP